MEIQRPGKCPNCGEENLRYNRKTVSDGNCVGYKWVCTNINCKAKGTEWYSLEFIEHEVKEKESVKQ